MLINLTNTDFTLASGAYYSIPFRQDEKDGLFSIGVTLGVNGNASLQCSINEADWGDVVDSSFACAPFGIQIFGNGHYLLVYRIKTDQVPIKAQVII